MIASSEGPTNLSGYTPSAAPRIGVLVLAVFTMATILFSARHAVAEPGTEKFKQATLSTQFRPIKAGTGTPFLELDVQSKPEIEAMIEQIKSALPEKTVLRNTVLFTNRSDRRFLATSWKTGNLGSFPDRMLLHRMPYPAGTELPVLHFEKKIDSQGVNLVPQSGHSLAPGGNPVMVVSVYHGGNAPDGENLRLILLNDTPVDVTPAWVEVRHNLRDLDGNGTMELVGSMMNWDDQIPECKDSCNSVVPVILIWRNREWVPACRKFAKSHREILASNESLIEYRKNKKYDKPWIVRALAFQALSYAQIGDHETAWKYGMEAVEMSGNPDHPLLPFLRKAKSLGNYQCPASAAQSADPHWRVQ